MSEQTQGVQNKWLLVIALVLGGVSVFVYNMHIRAVRNEYEGNKVKVVEITTDLEPGSRIKKDNIRPHQILADEVDKKSYGNVIPWSQRDWLLTQGGKKVNQAVSKNNFLLWEHVTGRGGTIPSAKLTEGMVLKAIEIDPSQSLGDALSAGDRVNLCGLFPAGNGYKSQRIIEAVRVVNIGGKGASSSSRRGTSKSYRKITIEVPENVSLKLDNVLTHMVGKAHLELRPLGEPLPSSYGSEQFMPVINPSVEKRFALTAKAPTR